MSNGDLIAIIVIAIILIIIFSSLLRRNKGHQRARELEQQGKYLEALDYYLKESIESAAKMVLRTPEASQILAFRRLEKKVSTNRMQQAFLDAARSYINTNEYHLASKAFVFAGKPFAAAKVFIDHGGVEYIPAAIQIIDQNDSLISNRDQAIRNLAKHAYNSKKYMKAAELLRTIGAEEEANTVLIAAATEMQKRGLDNKAKKLLSSAKRHDMALEHYLKEVEEYLTNGNFEKMRRSFSMAKDIFSNIKTEKKDESDLEFEMIGKKIKEYERILKTIDSARDILRKKQNNQAIAMYDELIEVLGDRTPASIFAEAALANENENPRYSSELFYRASKKASSPRAAESFRLRGKKLAILAQGFPSSSSEPIGEVSVSDVEEYCSVCRMKITEDSSVVRCPECGSPAHFAHLAEWLKIRGACPICKKRVKITRPQSQTI
ncbi:MAG: E3 ubiquitin-protein ligase [Candidatus Heimdallarchaeota archaeon]|nr:E3 ubiquitin-protein ligase [Candidatus Heimdallarchaeota archaeon]